MATTKITTNSLADASVTSAKLANSISIGTLGVTGDLTVDTNTFFVDSANNRVGIGTVSPASALHVAAGGVIRAYRSTNDRFASLYCDAIGGYVAGPVNDPLYLSAATNLYLVTNNNTNLTVNTAGNIGIGTTSPSAKLHTIATTEQLRVGYDASNYASVTVSSAGLVTLDAVGASAGFVLADPVTATAQPVLSAMADTHVITKGVADIGYGQKTYHTISTTSTTILASYDNLFSRSLPVGQYRFEYRVWVKNNEASANISPRIGFATSSGTISVDGIRENRYNQGSFLSACFRNQTSANHDGGNLTVGSPNFTEGSMAMFGFINVTAAAVVLFRFTHNGSAPTNPTTVEGHLVLESLTAS